MRYVCFLFAIVISICGNRYCMSEETSSHNRDVVVGAIRWDAWSGGSVTAQVEKTLGPKKYHDRLPWYAEVSGDGSVRIMGGTQDIMDREIRGAARAGLDYWAFVMYPESDSMSKGLQLYLSSLHREKIKFCMILHNNLGVGGNDWPKERDRIVTLLEDPCYQRVLGDRPLVYCFGANPQRFQNLRQYLEQKEIRPYYVYMGWNPPADFKKESENGFDAVSAYADGSNVRTYAELVNAAESRWDSAAKAGIRYIPLVTTGWNKEPRKDNPVSWEKDAAYHRQEVFTSLAAPEEIALHLGRAVDFVRKNHEVCPAAAVILYAWNENDEGGWIVPTWKSGGKPDTSRLDAIRKILNPR